MMVTKRKAAVATAGVVVAGGLVFGATEAFAASPSTSPTASATSAASSSASSPCKDHAHPARCALRREAGRHRGELFKRGAHGQATVKDSAGSYVVDEWQVGKVASVSGSTVTVTDASGTTWTWSVSTSTKYHVDGKAGSLSGVHVGDTILLRGRQSGSTNNAAAVFDPNQSKLAAHASSTSTAS
jgi:hypothetical protein